MYGKPLRASILETIELHESSLVELASPPPVPADMPGVGIPAPAIPLRDDGVVPPAGGRVESALDTLSLRRQHLGLFGGPIYRLRGLAARLGQGPATPTKRLRPHIAALGQLFTRVIGGVRGWLPALRADRLRTGFAARATRLDQRFSRCLAVTRQQVAEVRLSGLHLAKSLATALCRIVNSTVGRARQLGGDLSRLCVIPGRTLVERARVLRLMATAPANAVTVVTEPGSDGKYLLRIELRLRRSALKRFQQQLGAVFAERSAQHQVATSATLPAPFAIGPDEDSTTVPGTTAAFAEESTAPDASLSTLALVCRDKL